jgi:hypothetical protein
MGRFLLLSDSRHHPHQFPARVFYLPQCLLLLWASHLRQGFGEPPAGTMQNGHRHLQIVLHLFHCRGLGRRGLPLRFQKQFRLGENALASHARAFAPSCIELPGLPRVAMVRDESGAHAHAIVGVDTRHGHQILHRHLRPEFALAHLLLDRFRQQLHQRQPP